MGDNMAAFEPFHVGRHKCIGQKLAWAEMRLVLARLLYSFDMVAADASLRDFGEQNSCIFWEKQPLRVGLTFRKESW